MSKERDIDIASEYFIVYGTAISDIRKAIQHVEEMGKTNFIELYGTPKEFLSHMKEFVSDIHDATPSEQANALVALSAFGVVGKLKDEINNLKGFFK